MRHIARLAAAALVAIAAHSAKAETHVALSRFDATQAGDSFFGVQSPRDIERVGLRLKLTGDYANQPLVIKSVANDQDIAGRVKHQAFLNIGAAVDLFHRLTLNADLPVAVWQEGHSTMADIPSAHGAHVGDLRFGARLLVLKLHPLLRLSVNGQLWIPLGSDHSGAGAFVSDHKPRGRAELVVHGDSGRFVWAASAGYDFRREQEFVNSLVGDQVRITAAAGVRFFDNRLQVGPEAAASLETRVGDKYNRYLEALLGVRYYKPRGIDVGVAAGPGFSSGVGTPDYRIIASLGWAFAWDAPKPAPAPVAEPTPAPAVEPAPQPEPPPPPAPDRDGDGVADARDACVDVPGDAEHDGCPAVLDTDQDGIVDEVDACPADAGVADPDPVRNGCPPARIVGDQIVIMDAIQFENNKSTIKADSEDVLLAILKAVSSLPTDSRFVVQGHTDSRGSAKRNKALSEARAQAVVAWLAAHGVDAARFTAEGYGPAKPIADNKTEAGRKANRRVEIQIVR